jgi:hypothetical protein
VWSHYFGYFLLGHVRWVTVWLGSGFFGYATFAYMHLGIYPCSLDFDQTNYYLVWSHYFGYFLLTNLCSEKKEKWEKGEREGKGGKGRKRGKGKEKGENKGHVILV